MNRHLQAFAREELKKGLLRIPEQHQYRFKQMYAHGNLDLSICEVVDQMEEERLDWAMTQVENTLRKLCIT